MNKAILASCWGTFAERLSDKTDVVEVPAKFTSQQCHSCGHIDARNRESQAELRCVACGNSGHADVHAGPALAWLQITGLCPSVSLGLPAGVTERQRLVERGGLTAHAHRLLAVVAIPSGAVGQVPGGVRIGAALDQFS